MTSTNRHLHRGLPATALLAAGLALAAVLAAPLAGFGDAAAQSQGQSSSQGASSAGGGNSGGSNGGGASRGGGNGGGQQTSRTEGGDPGALRLPPPCPPGASAAVLRGGNCTPWTPPPRAESKEGCECRVIRKGGRMMKDCYVLLPSDQIHYCENRRPS